MRDLAENVCVDLVAPAVAARITVDKKFPSKNGLRCAQSNQYGCKCRRDIVF
jgi:hypothetical protein